MAGLVIGGHLLLVVGHHHRAPLGAHHDLVAGIVEFLRCDQALAAPRSEQRRFVDQVGDVGAREARSPPGDHPRIDVGCKRHPLHVNGENLFAALDVGTRDHHLSVEAAGTQQRRVEHVGPVGRGDDDDAFVGFEPVHLDQQLVERLFALVVAIAKARTAMAADCVDFVDKHDARSRLLCLGEHVADPARTDADEHLDEVRTRNGEERNPRLTRNRAGEQGLAGSGRPDQQRTLGDLAAEPREFARVLEKFDDLFEFFARFVDPGDVGKGHSALLFGQLAGAALAKTHRAAARILLHLTHDEETDPEDQQERERLVEQDQPEARLLGFLGLNGDALGDQPLGNLRIGRGGGSKSLPVAELAADHLVSARPGRGRNRAHIALVDLTDEIGIGHCFTRRRASAAVDHLSEQHQSEQNSGPDQQALGPRVGRLLVVLVHVGPLDEGGWN